MRKKQVKTSDDHYFEALGWGVLTAITSVMGFFKLPDLLERSFGSSEAFIAALAGIFGVSWWLLFLTLNSIFNGRKQSLIEKGEDPKSPIMVRLANSEWLKTFVVGVASSICASLIMLVFLNAA